MPLSVEASLIGLALLASIWLWARRVERRYEPGKPPLLPPMLVQFLAVICMVLIAAHLVSVLTGVRWTSPFARY